MSDYAKILGVSFVLCCIVKSEVLTALWLLAAMVPVVAWFFREAVKRL